MKVSAALLLLAVGCGGSSSSVSEAPAASAGRVERVRIGDLEAWVLEDGPLVVPNDGKMLAVGRPTSETAEVLAAAGLPRDTVRFDIQCLLVKAGDRVILFDTGTGDPSFGDTGHLPESLAAAGVAPAVVTDVVISHAHGDHVGGLVTEAGALAFPAATIHISAPEWASLQASTDDGSQRLVAAIAPTVTPFEPGAQVLPLVKAVATPGHTPGHSSFEIGAGADPLFYLGDLAHHSVVSVQHPDWSFLVDGDHPAAEAMRQQMLTTLAGDHTRVFAPHFPFPGLGHVVADAPGLAWRPEPR